MNAPLATSDDRGLIATVVGDGRPLIVLTALSLLGSGLFASFQAATGELLPHDVAYLGMTARQICSLQGCRILHFMIHDRISFGGVLVGIGVMYTWLALFPMARGEHWAWWAVAVSGTFGFLSFLTYLGYGYLDTWHGFATLLLLPVFLVGMTRTRALCVHRVRPRPIGYRTPQEFGRLLLLGATAGIVSAGMTISAVGATVVFVPQDLEFMGLQAADLRAINARLVPLIAHDRAGFGGALVSCGLAMFLSILFAPPSRSLRQALLLTGLAGFGTAIGVHPAVGYLSATHLAPAVLGCFVFLAGLVLAGPEGREDGRS